MIAKEAPADDGTGSRFTPSCNLRPSCARHKQLDHDAERTIGETRHYLDDAEQLLRSETTAVDFFNAKIERYPNHLAWTVFRASARPLYGVREHPGDDVGQILVAAWL